VPRRHPVEFRRKVPDLVEAGKPVAEIAVQLGVSDQTIYNWRNQDRIDCGRRAGVSTVESAELAAARSGSASSNNPPRAAQQGNSAGAPTSSASSPTTRP
jgi:transposase-like protein